MHGKTDPRCFQGVYVSHPLAIVETNVCLCIECVFPVIVFQQARLLVYLDFLAPTVLIMRFYIGRSMRQNSVAHYQWVDKLRRPKHLLTTSVFDKRG